MIFLFFKVSRLALGPPTCPFNLYQGLFSPGVKWSECEAYHFPPSIFKVKNDWSYTSTPSYAFIACIKKLCLVESNSYIYYIFLADIHSAKINVDV
jgi:hypothetical protein